MMRLHVQIVSHRLKTDIKKVQRKKRRNAMLSNSIKLEQVNTEIRCDSLMAFWYTAEGPSYIKS